MNRYQLAKIVSWADKLQGRKRLQKVIYLLQGAGCPLEAEYTLHLFGPYSQEVARLSDEMVQAKLLEEESALNAVGRQYSYRLTDQARQGMAVLEATDQGKKWQAALVQFELLGKELLKADLQELEYSSTIVYFKRQGHDWNEAVEKACTFKGTQAVRRHLDLAKKVVGG